MEFGMARKHEREMERRMAQSLANVCDQMMDVQDALDKRDLEKRLRGGWMGGKG
jgi:molecular chaperone GrpE (heat shock protein)